MHKLEKPCKILLLINSFIAVLGYISFIQTNYQLVSTLIPSSMVYQIAKPNIIASLPATILLIISLGFYFFHKRISVIIISSLAIISYIVLSN